MGVRSSERLSVTALLNARGLGEVVPCAEQLNISRGQRRATLRERYDVVEMKLIDGAA